MILNELTIHTNTLGSELVGGVLVSAGISCFVTEDFGDLQDVIEQKSIPFDYIEDDLLVDPGEVRVKVYLTPDEQGSIQAEEIVQGVKKLKDEGEFDLGTLEITFAEVNEDDWANNWKEFFHPLQIGNRFVVKPTWESYEPDGRIVLEIDPASSFGTGRHETTALCLEELENEPLEDASLLDMGCGSGILGIGAALLGATDVVCVDIEEGAAKAAAENARVNGLPENVLRSYCGNVLDDRNLRQQVIRKNRYDFIAANIVADVIVQMLPLFEECLRPGGVMVLSGILSTRREDVLEALAAKGFTIRKSRERNDWAVIVVEK